MSAVHIAYTHSAALVQIFNVTVLFQAAFLSLFKEPLFASMLVFRLSLCESSSRGRHS